MSPHISAVRRPEPVTGSPEHRNNDNGRMAESLRDTEPANWYRGVHEGGHGVAIWKLDATVTKIEARRTHFDDLSPRQRAVVAKAGVAAEELFENRDIRGCQDDERRFNEAINETRATEGEGAAHQAFMDATDQVRRIVRDQRAAIEAMADPIAELVHGPSVNGIAALSGPEAETIVRPHWAGPLPRALAIDCQPYEGHRPQTPATDSASARRARPASRTWCSSEAPARCASWARATSPPRSRSSPGPPNDRLGCRRTPRRPNPASDVVVAFVAGGKGWAYAGVCERRRSTSSR